MNYLIAARGLLVASAFGLAVSMGGCSVHPLPEDVTGVRTVDIAEHIRCEARNAIEAKAIEMLRHADPRPPGDSRPPIPGAAQLAEGLEKHTIPFKNVKKYLNNAREKAFYDRYIQTSIAYDFTFDMSEDNAAITQVDFVKLLTNSLTPNNTFSLGIGATSDRFRQNIRKFLVADTFDDLINGDVKDCEHVPVGPNLVYPIVGSIGLDELISTFIDLNEEGIFDETVAKDKAPALADQLQFNTSFTSSVAPKVVLTPTQHAFRLVDAGLTANNSRVDKHAVIIGLSLPPRKKEPPRPATPAFGVGVLSRSVFATRKLSPAETRAVESIAQFRIDLYYDRSASVVVR